MGLSIRQESTFWKHSPKARGDAGSVALYHALGVTPEAKAQDPFHRLKPQEVYPVNRRDLDEMEQEISTAPPGTPVDLITFGCPLLSVSELAAIFDKMENRRVKRGIHLWIYLSQETYEHAGSLGLIDPLEKAGIRFSTGTCATISPLKVWEFSHVMTNSAKCALVIPSEHGVRTTYRDTDGCIRAATERT